MPETDPNRAASDRDSSDLELFDLDPSDLVATDLVASGLEPFDPEPFDLEASGPEPSDLEVSGLAFDPASEPSVAVVSFVESFALGCSSFVACPVVAFVHVERSFDMAACFRPGIVVSLELPRARAL